MFIEFFAFFLVAVVVAYVYHRTLLIQIDSIIDSILHSNNSPKQFC